MKKPETTALAFPKKIKILGTILTSFTLTSFVYFCISPKTNILKDRFTLVNIPFVLKDLLSP